MNNPERVIAIKDYYGPGEHIYEDQLGFQKDAYEEARTYVAREAFRFHVETCGLDMAFYYPETDTFYGIHTEVYPVRVKVLPRYRDRSEYIGWQCDNDTHDEPVEVIAVFKDRYQIWDGLKINGKSLEEVLRHSYITSIF